MLTPKRHDLVYLKCGTKIELEPCAQKAILENTGLTEIIEEWINNNRPFVSRRPVLSKAGKISLGLPLPPARGKLRIGFKSNLEDALSIVQPLELKNCLSAVPVSWQDALYLLDQELRNHGSLPRVFGALALETATGLRYINTASDIDMLLDLKDITDMEAISNLLHKWPGPSKQLPDLDVEIILQDGAGFSWKELTTDAKDILIKGNDDVFLRSRKELGL